jgi:hypothetical protein
MLINLPCDNIMNITGVTRIRQGEEKLNDKVYIRPKGFLALCDIGPVYIKVG